MYSILIIRVDEPVEETDGYRMLVDRLWQRGISKERAKLDEWNKEIAPSTELRKWFRHDENKFESFEEKYREELNSKIDELKRIKSIASKQNLCLIYASKNPELSQISVLMIFLNELEISNSYDSLRYHILYLILYSLLI